MKEEEEEEGRLILPEGSDSFEDSHPSYLVLSRLRNSW